MPWRELLSEFLARDLWLPCLAILGLIVILSLIIRRGRKKRRSGEQGWLPLPFLTGLVFWAVLVGKFSYGRFFKGYRLDLSAWEWGAIICPLLLLTGLSLWAVRVGQDLPSKKLSIFRVLSILTLLTLAGSMWQSYQESRLDKLFMAAKTGDIQVVEKFLKEGNGPDTRSSGEGESILMAAAQGNQVEMIDVLLQAGANINATDGRGRTALYWAVYGGKGNSVKVLLARGADVRSDRSRVPLSKIAEARSPENFEAILELEKRSTAPIH